MKKGLFLFFCISLVLSFSYTTQIFAEHKPNIQVIIDGKVVVQNDNTGYATLSPANRTMIPLRLIAEEMGYRIDWQQKNNTIVLSNGIMSLTHVLGNTYVTDNENNVTDIDAPSYVDAITNRTMVPVRLITEAFGCEVGYNQTYIDGVLTNVATITTMNLPKETASPEAALSQQEIREILLAKKEDYPHGMSWTDDNKAYWKGGIYSYGTGCAAFAFLLSDAAFNDIPARKHYDFSNIKIGDLVRINKDTHFVIVTDIDDSQIIVAEGNLNDKVYWGRTFTFNELEEIADYVITRYPE